MASEDDLDILAWTMLGEAAGEGTQGMADVGHVVLNRLNNGKYGSSIADVAKSPKQFSTWNDGAGGNNPTGRFPKDSTEFKRARELAAQVVAGTIPGPPGKPLDYNAPSVSPYWADSKAKHGTYERNGHVFYPSVPVPPGEVPNAVGSLTDTVPPAAPVPATPLPSTAAMRGMTSPTGGNSDLQAALDQYATRERNRVIPQMPPIQSVQTVATIPSMPRPPQSGPSASDMTRGNAPRAASAPRPDLTAPGGVNGVFAGLSQDPATAAALAPRQSMFGDDPGTAANGPVVARIPSRPSFNGDPGTPASGPVVASIPSLPVPPMSRAPISYAGQEAIPGPIGKPPTTIAVKSVPMPPQVPRMDPIGSMPSMAAMQASLGRPMAADQMYEGIYPKEPGQFRIGSTDGLGAGVVGGRASTAILTGKVNEFGSPVTEPFQVASRAPTPFMRPPSFPTQFATAPRIAPVPFPPYRAVGSMRATTPMPMPFASRPPQQRSPLRIMVQGANPMQPQLTPQQALVAAGNAAVSQSGDYSTGNQAEAAQLIASGNAWRAAQESKTNAKK